MRKLVLGSAALAVVLDGSAQAAPFNKKMCAAFETIDLSSLDGFSTLPKIKADQGGWIVRPIIPGGSNGRVDEMHGGGMMFGLQSRDDFKTMKRNVTQCLPDVRVLSEDSQSIAPQIDYRTSNGMQITLSTTVTGINTITFSSKTGH